LLHAINAKTYFQILCLDTARDRRLYWLEFAIVLLITFDIVLSLLEKTGILTY
jgi:uncharacterized Rmd1/YagE family protein